MKRKRLSKISLMHYWKLVFRSVLFLAATVIYILNRIYNTGSMFGGIEDKPVILVLIWLVFVAEMLLRFFPSKLESMGCQKQFSCNYQPSEKENAQAKLLSNKVTLGVAALWILLNGCAGAIYYLGWIDEGILLLLSLAFSVCDMICILFFCPFQTWFMKNKCCTTCRIYNWDFAMMFTPLIFIPGIYTWSILAVAIALLIKWEVAVYRHPEWFSEETNKSLSCASCTEKLCHHKKQLQGFWKRNNLRK